MHNVFTFDASTIPEAKSILISNVISKGYIQKISRGSYEGEQIRYQYPMVCGRINNPLFDMVPVPPTKEWVPEQTIAACEEYYQNYILQGSNSVIEEYTYADRISRENQLQNVCEILSATPDTNHALLTVGAPEDLAIKYPACLRELHFKYFEGALHMYTIWRSHDLYGGFGMNMVGLTLLFRDIAWSSGHDLGKIFYISTGSHLYGMAKDFLFGER